jgi:hypothetical protein
MATIGDYSFGRIAVDGQEETRDLIVPPGRVVRNWWRRDGHWLVLDDLADVIDELPERLLVGTGAYGRLTPDPYTLGRLRARGIDVEALSTADARPPLPPTRSSPHRSCAAPHLLIARSPGWACRALFGFFTWLGRRVLVARRVQRLECGR